MTAAALSLMQLKYAKPELCRKMSLVRILVVDDHDFWRRSISSMLCKVPSFEVVSQVSDGLKAVRHAEQLQPTVVLLDISLPGLNGIEAGGWIRKLAAETKIVFVSEQFDRDIVDAALNLGAAGYVLKSDAAKELVTAIHTVARGEKFVSRQLADHRFKEILR